MIVIQRFLLLGAVSLFAFLPLQASAGTSQEHVMSMEGTSLITETLDGTVLTSLPLHDGGYEFDPAADGAAVVSDPGVWYVARDGGETQVDASADDHDPAISPDGSTITFVRSTTSGSDIYTVNADGSGLTRVASGHSVDLLSAPEFSPDGGTIAYWCSPVWPGQPPAGGLPKECGPLMDGTPTLAGLVIMNRDGTDKRQIYISPSSSSSVPVDQLSWSPDGRWIALYLQRVFQQNNYWTGDQQMFAFKSSGADLFADLDPGRQVTHDPLGDPSAFPSFSPDGTQILQMRFRDGAGKEGNFPYLINRAGGGSQELSLQGDGWRFVPPENGGAPPPTIDKTRLVVPRVRGLGYRTARGKLRRNHFLIGAIHRRFSDSLSRNRVIATRPRAGTVLHRHSKPGSVVEVVVSRGPRR
jgi:Tol biopolymer transport system component